MQDEKFRSDAAMAIPRRSVSGPRFPAFALLRASR
jgi:hypothetical protein